MRPTPHVLAEFGLAGSPFKLDGGQGRTWRCADAILKPLDMPVEALRWLDEVIRPRCGEGALRLSLPQRTVSGGLFVDGWTAFPYLTGTHESGRWAEIARVAAEFASIVVDVERPEFLDFREDRWAHADRFAWGEINLADVMDAPYVADLIDRRKSLVDAAGLIHGDMSGNVLFHPAEFPALIDLSIYWRPVNYAIAIAAVDAVCFEEAPLSLLSTISSDRQFPQHLVRALLFRIAADWLDGRPAQAFGAYDTAVTAVRTLTRAVWSPRPIRLLLDIM